MENETGGKEQQLVDEIESLRPESDTLMDEIDEMDPTLVEMKQMKAPLASGPAAKYEISADPTDEETVAAQDSEPGTGSTSETAIEALPNEKNVGAAADADADAVEENEEVRT